MVFYGMLMMFLSFRRALPAKPSTASIPAHELLNMSSMKIVFRPSLSVD
jgi:hypothetical protein